MQDAYTALVAHMGGAPSGEDVPDWRAPPVPGAAWLQDQMIAVAEAVFEAERKQASFLQARSAGADIPANHRPDGSARAVSDAVQSNGQTVELTKALLKAIHKEAPNPAAHGAGTQHRNGPTGHRDDPISIYPDGNAVTTRMPNG